MRICIIGQEEPSSFGPFFRKVIKARANEVVLVAIAGSRGAGGHPKNLKQKLRYIYSLLLIMEARGSMRIMLISLRYKLIQLFGLTGTRYDDLSIEGAAREHNIPVIHIGNPNSPEVINKLREFSPDVIINQSELLLKKAILEVPRVGVINRHGSLLPHFRGRLASFWSHFNEPPEYGVTIHFVDEGLDSGGIIVQKQFHLSPRLSYAEVVDTVFKKSAGIMLEALGKLSDSNFVPQANNYHGTPTYLFPTLEEAKRYRNVMARRRRGGSK